MSIASKAIVLPSGRVIQPVCLIPRYGRHYKVAHNRKPAGALPENRWTRLTIVFGADEFTVSVNNGEPRTFTNPVRYPTRRLYLGDGYEVDRWESNRGSEFLIDLASVRTRIVR